MSVEEHIRRVARRQNGSISWRQLRRIGLSEDEIRVRVTQGRLIRVFRGVYLVADPALLVLGREAAALLSLGPASLLSHRSAVVAWGVAAKDGETIDVTVIDSNPRSRAGVRIHHVTSLHPQDIATKSNLRLTSSEATSSELRHAFGEARAKRLINEHKLDQALKRAPQNHPGAARIRHLLQTEPAATYTRSKAERVLRKTLTAADLPQPMSNVPLLGYTRPTSSPQSTS